MFVKNGYPPKYVKYVIRKTSRTQSKEDQDENVIYLKLPFINEQLKRRALSVIRRTGLKNIRIHFLNGRSLAKVFAPPKSRISCPNNCDTCKLAHKTNQCQLKHTVYKITCMHCNIVYIGETARTIGSRIKEHLRMKKQTVYMHLRTHDTNPQEGSPIMWQILHRGVLKNNERRIIEAIEIQNHSSELMNGCIGRNICI